MRHALVHAASAGCKSRSRLAAQRACLSQNFCGAVFIRFSARLASSS
jgi:hypothetical protein